MTAPEQVPRPTTWGGRVVAAPIVAYRRWISPALPARCRFYPSCSAYALEALATHGAWRGPPLTPLRLLRRQPVHPGGDDPGAPHRRNHPKRDALRPHYTGATPSRRN